MVASKFQNTTVPAAEFLIFDWGIGKVMVASKIQISAAAEFRIFNLGTKEVLVVKNVDFADWPFPESAAAKSKTNKF